ncbi:MAG: response regulator [Acidobacteriia bacterium]|nr:response regulator [Terriglobia bacterium]
MALKVLLADDNITAQKMGCKILSDAGHTVIAVSNGAAAMKKIVAEKPELLILDVYMPGYSGLEVCEKVKNAAETAHVPVLLTVTNMEPFNAADGNRVRADGVLVKPFEASDLLAVVHKFEEKIHPAPPPDARTTVKMPALQDFEDESYAEWKAESTPEDEVVANAPDMSQEVGSAPALGIEDLGAAPARPVPEFGVEAAPAAFAAESQPETAPSFDVNAPSPVFGPEYTEAAAAVIAPPAELEFTSAPRTAAMEVAPAAELEVTAQESAAEVPIVQDASLVTERTDIAQFATKFGQEHPEEVPVGIAMQFASVETPSPHWGDPDVRGALGFSGGGAPAAAPAPEAEPEPEVGVDTQRLDAVPEPEAGIAESHNFTQQLVAQFAAELEAAQKEAPPAPAPQPEMEPMAQAAAAVAVLDEQQIEEAVGRVLERYKGVLIAAIVKELKS